MKSSFIKKIAAVFLLCLLCGCSPGKGTQQISDIDQLKNKRIGIMTGTIYDAIVKERFPDAEHYYFNTTTDLLSALLSHKIDAAVEDENVLNDSQKSSPEIILIGEPLSETPIAFAFPKNEKGDRLLEQMDKFIIEARESGKLKELEEKWENADDDVKMPDITKLNDRNGTLKLSTDPSVTPYSQIINGEIAGYEIEIAVLFCERYGYGLEIINTNFSGMISGVQSGKSDFTVGDLGVTEERKQSVNFSQPTAMVNGRVAVLDDSASENEDFLTRILDSLDKTFIRENRWILLVEGVGTTLLITVLSLILGTILGFAVYLKARKGNPLFVKTVKFFIWLIQGLPMVVLLMILYYIVFGKTSINNFYVAVLGFTLAFACSMYSMLEAGEKAVDKGQGEAAFTLGYTQSQTFFRIILPQAAYHFLPSYKAEIVSLIQATAVVGYIAVEDVTKMGDIIRSRTYEAFFPLIVIAIMYFAMAALLTAIVNRLDVRIDPNRRDVHKILEGVKQHD